MGAAATRGDYNTRSSSAIGIHARIASVTFGVPSECAGAETAMLVSSPIMNRSAQPTSQLRKRWRRSLLVATLLITVSRPEGVDSQASDLPLSSAEVSALIRATAEAVDSPGLAAAIVDRSGRILAVYARPAASSVAPDTAVTVARAAAMFSNADAPLSARTVRFISGIHFPPGVSNTPNAALYGIENTNRGCQLNADDTAPIERPRSIAGSGLAGPPLACAPGDTRGCARGEPMALDSANSTTFRGFSTGKSDVRDTPGPRGVNVTPGGFAVYRNGVVVGAVGVAGAPPDVAEYAGFVGAAATAPTTGLSPLPANPLPPPGAVFLEGLRLPFFDTCTSVQCVLDRINAGPPGVARGTFQVTDLRVTPRSGVRVADGYLIAPASAATPGGLTQADVARIVDQAVTRANLTRAQIRLPLGRSTRMIVAVSDENGNILAAFRMPDATIFSFDVAATKARNAYYFSSREGYEVLRSFVLGNTSTRYTWEPEPPSGAGWAITNRTLSFGGQPLFPPGIDLDRAPTPGPWFDLFLYDTANPCTEGPGPSRGANRRFLNQSGIVWFPGSAPLYKNGRLVGGVGVSGDGVEQDDYVTAAAVSGFDAPSELRVDRTAIRTPDGAEVRLPYWKFPRNPEVP